MCKDRSGGFAMKFVCFAGSVSVRPLIVYARCTDITGVVNFRDEAERVDG